MVVVAVVVEVVIDEEEEEEEEEDTFCSADFDRRGVGGAGGIEVDEHEEEDDRVSVEIDFFFFVERLLPTSFGARNSLSSIRAFFFSTYIK